MLKISWQSLAAAALLAGCSSASKPLSVSASSRGAATPATTATGSAPSTTAIDAGNGLSIERLRLVVARVELEGEPACAATSGPSGPSGPTGPSGMSDPTGMSPVAGHALSTGPSAGKADEDGHDADDGFPADHDGGPGDCTLRAGPFLVDLSGASLTGGVHFVAAVDVPFGTYEEVKFKLNTISAADAGANAGLLAMADAHASILVEGTRSTTANGVTTTAPFSFSTPMEAVQKHEGAIAVNAGSNVTLDVDPSGWFKAADGSLLDPADPAAQGAILANVRASIRVLEDDDHDGHDDGEEHGGGHH
jgi:hypothetical protein